MAHGAQDWIARTDMLVQSISELIMRPRLGTFTPVDVSGAVDPNTATLALAVIGAGMHFGAYFWIEATATVDNDNVRLVFDGVALDIPTFGTIKDMNFAQPVGSEGFGVCYDDVNHYYSGIYGGGKTWNTVLLAYYVETYGRTPTVHIKASHAIF